MTISVTDAPGTLGGNQGDAAKETVGDCSIAAAPALPAWSRALLALAVVAGGGAVLARGAGGRSPASPG